MNIEDLVTFEVNGKECAALFRTSDPDRCSQLEDIAKWLDGGEE